MYSQMFLELEQTAKEAGRGLWSIQGRLRWLDEERQSMYLEMSRMKAQIYVFQNGQVRAPQAF